MKTKLVTAAAKSAETANTAPLGAQEFAVLIEGFAPFPSPLRIAVAVSGGPDSMALAFYAERWLQMRNDGSALLVLIVDHALRPESAAEASSTRKALAKIGIEAEILSWQHPPVISRLHETARKERYRLLCEACRRHGIRDLLLAHHREDQAETILMRLAKGSGIDGLAGMKAQKIFEGVRILRPLLTIAKERLAATCAMSGLPFVSDPSNQSQKFARGRLRRVLPLLAEEGLTVERLQDLGARAAEAGAALDHAAFALVRVATACDESGAIRFNLEHLRSAPRATALRALAICLGSLHRSDYLPEHAALTRLLDALLLDGVMPPRTLAGCLVSKNTTHISMMREYAAITEILPLPPGGSVIWDQRWRVSLSARAGDEYVIRPLGNPTYDVLDGLAPNLRRLIAQGRARASLPALWFKEKLVLIPALPSARNKAEAVAEPILGWPPTRLPSTG